ncbi:MAG: hypothetical protein GXO23_01095 [Crenarchaeota archaeon]|nr:hypothetical protein [Thermoproteota archaeon]
MTAEAGILDLSQSFDEELYNAFIKRYGVDFKACMQCATCVSVCPLSDIVPGMPRLDMLLAGLGLFDEIARRLSPWICDQCMECSRHCPRKANPAKVLAALREIMTAKYDPTGITRRVVIGRAKAKAGKESGK